MVESHNTTICLETKAEGSGSPEKSIEPKGFDLEKTYRKEQNLKWKFKLIDSLKNPKEERILIETSQDFLLLLGIYTK